KLAGKFLVLAHIGRNHLVDLARLQEKPEAAIVDPGIVGDNREVFDARRAQREDQVFRNAAEAEAPGHYAHAVPEEAVEGRLRVFIDFFHRDCLFIIVPNVAPGMFYLPPGSDYFNRNQSRLPAEHWQSVG